MTSQSTDELLHQAMQYRLSRRPAQAREIYEQILQSQPACAEPLLQLGLLDCECGQLDSGIARIQQAIALRPDDFQASYNLGVALGEKKDSAGAIAAYRKAVEIKPSFAPAWYNLGSALDNAGETDDAASAYEQAIAARPNHAESHCNLGVVREKQGRLDDAISAYRNAVALNSRSPEVYFNLGHALRRRNDPIAEAITAFKTAVALRPDFVDAWFQLGNALTLAGSSDDIIATFRQVVALRPEHAEAHFNLAIALLGTGELEPAIASLRKVVSLKPEFAEGHYHMGLALKGAGDIKVATVALSVAVELRPDYFEAVYELASAYSEQGRLDEAAEYYQKVLKLRPDYPPALNNLAIVLKSAGRVEESIAAYRRCIAVKPDFVDAHSNLLMTLHYSVHSTPQSLRDEHRTWNDRHARPLLALVQPHGNNRDPNRRLRIGYVSGDFWDHAVARFFLPLISHHNHEQFEIFCYSNSSKNDPVTQSIRRHADHWQNIADLNDDQVARQIREHQIDILVDLSMHTQGNRLLVFARQPAPVQATWLGYAGTTGMPAVQWRLTDAVLDPVDRDIDQLYAEQSLRLPHCFWCYHPVHATGIVGPLRAIETGQVTFGCFNNFAKVSSQAQDLWAQILAAVPNSRLMIHCLQGSQRAELIERFAAHGVDAARIEFIGRRPLLEYLNLHWHVDIALDPFPFSGGTTTCDALWMGVPVVTLRGETAVSRGGASLLSAIGLQDWIAENPDQYIQIAQKNSEDLPRLTLLRSSLRQRMQQSPLMDAGRFATAMESAFSTMWRSFLQGATASSAPG